MTKQYKANARIDRNSGPCGLDLVEWDENSLEEARAINQHARLNPAIEDTLVKTEAYAHASEIYAREAQAQIKRFLRDGVDLNDAIESLNETVILMQGNASLAQEFLDYL